MSKKEVDTEELRKSSARLKAEGRWEESSGLYMQLLEHSKGCGDDPLVLEAALGLGDCEMNRSNYRISVEHYLVAMRTAEALKDDMSRAEALRGLGYVHWRKGDLEMALEYLGTGLTLLAGSDNMELLARVHVDIGNIHSTRDDIEQAKVHYLKAIEIHRDDPSLPKNELARAYNNLGDVIARFGHTAEALGYFERCMELSREVKDTSNLGWALFNAAEAQIKLGGVEKARTYLEESERYMEEADDRFGASVVLRIFGVLNHREGRLDQARQSFEMAITIMRVLDSPEELAQMLHQYGELLLDMDNLEGAGEALKEARAIYKELDLPQEERVEDLMADHGLL